MLWMRIGETVISARNREESEKHFLFKLRISGVVFDGILGEST
jgi:hypothetical protein